VKKGDMRIPEFLSKGRRERIRLWKLSVLAAIAIGVGAIMIADMVCDRATEGRIHHSVETLPMHDVGLVLGTSKTTSSGKENLHFRQRIDAAARLYQAGKVKHLLVSGDNHTRSYDEPSDMKNALQAAGVPGQAITCDYAGFRTLDSVLRAHSVFGLSQFVVITEEFHCPRAVWIARRHGLNAVAFAAPDVPMAAWAVRVKARESLARVLCGMDLYLLNRGPKFPGPPEPIQLSSAIP
jgi:SanA protein